MGNCSIFSFIIIIIIIIIHNYYILCVKIQNETSPFQTITHEVPQRSILGPLLFLCYINDFTKYHNAFPLEQAKDADADASGNNVPSIENLVNVTINQIYELLVANKLSLNTNKTTV